jgi:16S rRNA (uracil1498-N3)-methyltransferase
MNRFFIPKECIQEGRVEFPAEVSHQILRVLRLRTYDHVVALDNLGMMYAVELDMVQPRGVTGNIIETKAALGEAKTSITLYLGLTQREKFEWILQKTTEIGVAAFVPLITQRSLVQSAHDIDNKLERWERIIREAAEQSGRGLCPKLYPLQHIDRLQQLSPDQKGFVLWEEEQGQGFKSALRGCTDLRLSLLIGPEGGLTEDEIDRAKTAGFVAVSLGKRILRMETAAIVAAAVTLYERGDMETGN